MLDFCHRCLNGVGCRQARNLQPQALTARPPGTAAEKREAVCPGLSS